MSDRPLAVRAWDEWIASNEGQRCRSAVTLQAPERMTRYLENRLNAAFMAGLRAGENARPRTDG